jgi:uncharacterized protein
MDPIITTQEQIEFRSIEVDQAEIRADINSRSVEGYAIVFNSESRLIEGKFTEIIEPTALNGVLERSDVLALLDHKREKGVLARSKYGIGSLKLSVDNKGLKYSFEAPKFPLGDELIEGIKRGDIRSSSFSFYVSSGQKWEKRSDGSYLRRIKQMDLLQDVSPTYKAAYNEATVALRNLDTFIISEVHTENPINPDMANTIPGGTIENPVIKSDNERYLRQLNYSLKIKNK